MNHAKIFQSQEKESGLKGAGQVFGLRCGVLLGSFDPDTLSLKTSVQLLFEDSTECLVRLPRSGMMRNGKIFVQRTWVRRIEGKESGSWLTPSVEDAGRQGKAEAWQEYREHGRTTQARLRNQVMATPMAKGNQLSPSMQKHPGCRNLWPTPTNDAEKFPTPREFMHKDATVSGLSHRDWYAPIPPSLG